MFKSRIRKTMDKMITELEHKISVAVDEAEKHPNDKCYVRNLYMYLDQWTILNEVKRRAKSK